MAIDRERVQWWSIVGLAAGMVVVGAVVGAALGRLLLPRPAAPTAQSEAAPIGAGDVWVLGPIDEVWEPVAAALVPPLPDDWKRAVLTAADAGGGLHYVFAAWPPSEQMELAHFWELAFPDPLDPSKAELVGEVTGHLYLFAVGCFREAAHARQPQADASECAEFQP